MCKARDNTRKDQENASDKGSSSLEVERVIGRTDWR